MENTENDIFGEQRNPRPGGNNLSTPAKPPGKKSIKTMGAQGIIILCVSYLNLPVKKDVDFHITIFAKGQYRQAFFEKTNFQRGKYSVWGLVTITYSAI